MTRRGAAGKERPLQLEGILVFGIEAAEPAASRATKRHRGVASRPGECRRRRDKHRIARLARDSKGDRNGRVGAIFSSSSAKRCAVSPRSRVIGPQGHSRAGQAASVKSRVACPDSLKPRARRFK